MEVFVFQGLMLAFLASMACFFAFAQTVLQLHPLRTRQPGDLSESEKMSFKDWVQSFDSLLQSALIGKSLFSTLWVVAAGIHVMPSTGPFQYLAILLILGNVLVCFELVPTLLGRVYSHEVSAVIVLSLRPFLHFLYPVYWGLHFFSRFSRLRLHSKFLKSTPQITEAEIEYLINIGEEEGVLGDDKHEMLSGVFELGDTMVREIMVHRGDMKCMGDHRLLRELLKMSHETGFSRIPIFKDEIDKIVGVVHVKDVMSVAIRSANDLAEPISAYLVKHPRPPLYIPESKPVDQLFQEMRKSRKHLAVVLDEYGSVCGIVTMEDVLEEIVGEVRDEFDNEEEVIRPGVKLGEFYVESKISIDDFLEAFKLDADLVLPKDSSAQFDTLAGLILHRFGQIPKIGDQLELGDVTITVVEVSKRRVRKVCVQMQGRHFEEDGDSRVAEKGVEKESAG
jgi:putative hemolysin